MYFFLLLDLTKTTFFYSLLTILFDRLLLGIPAGRAKRSLACGTIVSISLMEKL